MGQGVEYYFELIEVICIIGLSLVLFPFLSGYWTKPLVTYADDKTALDTEGTIEEQDASYDGSIFDVMLGLCVMVKDGCKSGAVQVMLGGDDVVKVDTSESDTWELEKISAVAKVWNKAWRDRGSAALALEYNTLEFHPGRIDAVDEYVSQEGWWVYSLE